MIEILWAQFVVRSLFPWLITDSTDFNQLYPVKSSFGAPIFFSLERAAAPYFGIKVCFVALWNLFSLVLCSQLKSKLNSAYMVSF